MAPRIGHMKPLHHVFGYLRNKPKGKIIIDGSDPPIRDKLSITRGQNWSEFYPDAVESLPDMLQT